MHCYMRDITYSYVAWRHDTFYVTWRIQTCHDTREPDALVHAWHDVFMRHMSTWRIHMWHDAFIRDTTRGNLMHWYICDRTCSYVAQRHDAFISHMTHPYANLTHVQWLTGWRRPIGCLKLQVIFRERATNYRARLRKMTYDDKASDDSTPPCTQMSYDDMTHSYVTWRIHTWHDMRGSCKVAKTYRMPYLAGLFPQTSQSAN